MKTIVLAGTKKGLFLLTSAARRRWSLSGPHLTGREINHATYDPRTGRIYATSNDAWFGSEIAWSPNLGKKWESAKRNPAFDKKAKLKLDRIWHIEPGRVKEKKVLYAGVAPAALFRSEDGGKTWGEIKTLTAHPSRSRWHPGAGGLCLHSIVVDPTDGLRMFVGISAVGVFRTEDGGKTWNVANKGTRAEFMPNKYPEFGQCVHKLLLADGGRSVLFQQNHCGVYRSADGGQNWQEISLGLPSDFGFPLAIHPHERETIYVIPLKGAEFRCPPDNKLRVYRSTNGGRKWQALAVDSRDPAGVYFGTNTGKLFASRDDGDSWQTIAENLPPIYSVATAEV